MTEGLKHWRDIKEKTIGNGNIDYVVELNGTSYSVGMKLKDGTIEEYKQIDDRLLNLLEYLRNSEDRVRIWYGDRETGRAWNEEYYIMGTIGRSRGTDWKIPILVNNSRSWGGGGLLLSSLIRIDSTKEHRTLWKVNNFHVEKMEVVKVTEPRYSGDTMEYSYSVIQHKDDGTKSNVANFKTEEQAKRWIQFMNGERYSK